MARLCLACQTTVRNQSEHCPTCGRNLTENERVWTRGRAAWRHYLDQTGWYPGRRDEWVDLRLQAPIHEPGRRAEPPRRLVSRYLGGHPQFPQAERVMLLRTADTVVMRVATWWPARASQVAIPLRSVRSVTSQRTHESTPDEAVVTAAIGGARTGPLGLVFGAAIGRRGRLIRTVHVTVELDEGPAELVFRPLDTHGPGSQVALVRIFQSPVAGRQLPEKRTED